MAASLPSHRYPTHEPHEGGLHSCRSQSGTARQSTNPGPKTQYVGRNTLARACGRVMMRSCSSTHTSSERISPSATSWLEESPGDSAAALT